MEGQERSGNFMEGHGRSYPNTRSVDNVRKVMGGWLGGGGGLQNYSAIPWSRSFLFSEILRDLLRFDCDWTGHGPGPVIAIYVFRHFSAETWHAVLNLASSLYKCPKHNLVKQ